MKGIDMRYTESEKCLLALALASSVFTAQGVSFAQTQDQPRQQDQVFEKSRERERLPDDEPIFGRQLMTEQERSEYRQKMRSAKTKEEREAIRVQHHEEMKARAKARGVNLPDQPPPRGMGYGGGGPSGQGPGAGGQGPGPGPGGGR
jgi:hypothetical protein